MSATHVSDSTPAVPDRLYIAFELGWTTWNLAFTTAMAQKPRLRSIPARDLVALTREIQHAKQRFHLPDQTQVLSCYEASRDGFLDFKLLSCTRYNRLAPKLSTRAA